MIGQKGYAFHLKRRWPEKKKTMLPWAHHGPILFSTSSDSNSNSNEKGKRKSWWRSSSIDAKKAFERERESNHSALMCSCDDGSCFTRREAMGNWIIRHSCAHVLHLTQSHNNLCCGERWGMHTLVVSKSLEFNWSWQTTKLTPCSILLRQTD